MRRMWINQPSILQPLHHLHGTLVLAVPDTDTVMKAYFLGGSTISQQVPENALSEGWPGHLTIREITADPDDITNGVIAFEATADPAIAQAVIDAPIGNNGRSDWCWIRLANGDLLLACWPNGETYEETEADPNRP